jgi:hypothetical protein
MINQGFRIDKSADYLLSTFLRALLVLFHFFHHSKLNFVRNSAIHGREIQGIQNKEFNSCANNGLITD